MRTRPSLAHFSTARQGRRRRRSCPCGRACHPPKALWPRSVAGRRVSNLTLCADAKLSASDRARLALKPLAALHITCTQIPTLPAASHRLSPLPAVRRPFPSLSPLPALPAANLLPIHSTGAIERIVLENARSLASPGSRSRGAAARSRCAISQPAPSKIESTRYSRQCRNEPV